MFVFMGIILFVILLGSVMIGLHGFSFFTGAPKPVAFAGVLSATMPDGTVIAWRSKTDETWAGVAQLHGGKWAVLADGKVRGNVTASTSNSWTAHKGEYQAEWVIVPVRPI